MGGRRACEVRGAPAPMTSADRMGSPIARSTGYQVLLTVLLSLNFGIVLFDRNALGFLMPFIQPELGLTNTQIGLLSSGLSLTWAIAAFGIGVVADKFGSRKRLLVVSTVVFALCSFGSGIATSFAMMLVARLLMGAAEGGIMPISQSMIATEVAPRHRGLAMGVAQGFGSSLMGSFVAPVLLVAFATSFGWRTSFFLAGVPGIVTAILIAWLIREAPAVPADRPIATQAASKREVLKDRNIILCALLGVLLVSYLVVCWAFMPLYLTQERRYEPSTMGWIMGALGISATIASTAIPALSDRIGRRPLMILMPFIAVILPLAALYYTGPAWMLASIFFVGWGVTGVFPLFMATIPSESVDARHMATALGVCMGTGEILGGVLSPFLAGYAADRVGLQAPLWMMAGLALVAALISLGLRETAPRALARVPSAVAARSS
jgi:MFS transporter, ACS family, hexuronate transporter